MRRVKRSSSRPVGAGQSELSIVERTASVVASNFSVSRMTPSVVSEECVISNVPFVKRCVPVASVKRQLRNVVSPFVASASPRDVLSSTLKECKRAAVANKSKRTLERLADCSGPVALRRSRSSSVVLH